MVMTPSVMVQLGTRASDFALPDTTGRTVKRSDLDEKPLLVMFICNHCPFVKHIRTHLAATCKEYQAKGVGIVGISSNDAASYPDDGPQKMALELATAGYTFPYLYDATQEVARAYHAACTPDFFLFDKAHQLVYRGRYDESRPESGIPVSGADLKRALDAVLAGKAVPGEQKGSIGCNIKWRRGNEPAYFKP